MAKYKVVGSSARISHGIVKLSEKQADLRKHNLESLGSGRYRVTAPVEFKRGEGLEVEGEVGKALALQLEDEEAVTAKEPNDKKKKAAKEPKPDKQQDPETKAD